MSKNDKGRAGIRDCMGKRSPAPPGVTKQGAVDFTEVASLAAHGHTEEEIAVRLGLEWPLEAHLREAVAAAVKKGRALGSGAIKTVRYEAALDGKVAAQNQVLSDLKGGPEEEPDEDETIIVKRRIIQPGGETEEGTRR